MGLGAGVDIISDGENLCWNDPQKGGYAKIVTDANHETEHASMLLAGASANSLFTKYGVRAYDTCATNITIGTTALTHSLSNERPRFQTYTRKCILSAAASEIRFASANFTADPVEKALSIDVYIESMPTEYQAPNNPYITVNISNTTSLGANYSRWSFGAGYLRQGWNTLKMRQLDTVSSTDGAGNLPTGQQHPADIGTGFDWNSTGQFFALAFNNMNGQTVHIDELRRPAKAKPVITIGFDSSGATATDEVFVTKVAPLFEQYGIRSYCTMTNVYELIYSGSQAWTRMAKLYNKYGWDTINHTWNHGATDIGRVVTLTSLSRTSNLCTATVSGGHNLPVNKVIKVSIQGATPSDMNGVFDTTVTSTTQFTYSAAGADGAGTGTIKFYTFLSEVFTTNNAENQRLLEHELRDISLVLKANGFSRSVPFVAFPNNSIPELSLLQTVAAKSNIKYGRGYRGGMTFVNEFGVDNPLNMGSIILDSGASIFTQTSTIQAKVASAIARGEHLHIFGHFILDDEDPANAAYAPVAPDYPPGQGGNPAPPAGISLSGYGGWWYMSQLRKLVTETLGPAIVSGAILVLRPSDYALYMGEL